MKQNLQRKLDKYKISISQQPIDLSKGNKIGLASVAAMAAMVTIPVELNSQVVCGDQGAPTRTIGSCIGGAGNLGAFYTNFCAKFDFDGDGINELQVRYYNYAGVYPKGSAYIDPIGVNIYTVLLGDSYFGYGTFPQTPTSQTWAYNNEYRDKLYIVPLSTGSGYGFIAFDMDAHAWLPDGSGVHPNTGQPICCYNTGLPSMWGGDSGITIADFNITSADMTDCGNASPALPVEFSKFEARAQERSILLEWATESEINNSGFDVERSVDGKHFETIAFVKGAGNSNQREQYSYEDSSVKVNTNYFYRLKQVDFDGKNEYSEIVTSKIEGDSFDFVLGPNPSSGSNAIYIAGSMVESSTIEMYNSTGALILTKRLTSGNTQEDIDVSQLSDGIYFVKVIKGGNAIYKKLVIN